MFMTWIHFYFRADPGSGPHQNDLKHCLLVFITGSGPVSLIPSGLDSTIPIEYPEYMHSDAKLFISSLLQVFHKYYRISRIYAFRTQALYILSSTGIPQIL